MNWKEFIADELKKEYMIKLSKFLSAEERLYEIYPPKKDIFAAYDLTELNKIKVVLLGMDPYINPCQAMGLSFSVREGISIPPSLKNIFKEIKNDLQIEEEFTSGDLTVWGKQGVFLLNSMLSVRKGESGSHSKSGWQEFTDNTIKLINEQDRPIVFILLGNFARNKKKLLNNKKHLILEASHPSPLSAHNGFFGCKVFSKTNKFLTDNGIEPIDWRVK